MGKAWLVAVSLALLLFVGGYVFLGEPDVDVSTVAVEQNGHALMLYFNFCPVQDTASATVNEYDDRVEIHVEVRQQNADCAGQLLVSLSAPLQNRKVIVGSPRQTFEFCGSDTLCRD